MTDMASSLRVLEKKSPDADVPRETIRFAAGPPMELEVGTRTGPGWAAPSSIARSKAIDPLCGSTPDG